MATQDHKRKVAAQTGIYLAIIIAIAVVVNLFSIGMRKRVDLTATERYTLSVGSGRLVKSLKEPIQVDAYIARGTAQLDAFVRDLTDLLKEYQSKGDGKFKFTLIEASTEELKERAKEAGLQPMTFGEASATGGDQATIAQGYMGLVFKYKSEKDVIPQLDPSRAEGLEFWITNQIREIRDKAENIKHKVGVVTNKDELKLSDNNLLARRGQQGSPSIQQILTQAFPFYSIEDVDLKDGAEPIKDELAGLVITQPRKDYSDKELRRIDEFLMKGNKSLVVIASAVTLKPQDPAMEATLSTHNLDKLLAGYGVNMKKNAVLDFGAQFAIIVPTQTGQIQQIRHPGILHVVADPRMDKGEELLDPGFAAFFRMQELAFPFVSSLEILKDKQPSDVELKVVARSTPSTSTAEGESIDMKLKAHWEPKPPMAQQVIAATLKGKLKSAFAGQKDESVPAPEVAAAPSRVLVISSSLFLTNPFAYAGNGQELGGQFQMMGSIGGDPTLQAIANPYAQRYLNNTIIAVKNILDWMTGDADLVESSAKILTEPNLTYASLGRPKLTGKENDADVKRIDEEYRQKRAGLQQSVQWSLTLGVPVLFALIGLGRWRYRENQKVKKAA
ncbi:MAG TPA: Gldg family protein [Polyangiaceae bacterium]|nr:Gldg family protein [Polyangiaceae bacterium]